MVGASIFVFLLLIIVLHNGRRFHELEPRGGGVRWNSVHISFLNTQNSIFHEEDFNLCDFSSI